MDKFTRLGIVAIATTNNQNDDGEETDDRDYPNELSPEIEVLNANSVKVSLTQVYSTNEWTGIDATRVAYRKQGTQQMFYTNVVTSENSADAGIAEFVVAGLIAATTYEFYPQARIALI